MNICLLLACFLLAAFGGVDQKKLECKDFKRGTFKSLTLPNGFVGEMVRSDSVQIEKLITRDYKQRSEHKIYWTSECSYELIFVGTDNLKYSVFKPNDTLKFTIEGITDANEFCISFRYKGELYRDTVIKVK